MRVLKIIFKSFLALFLTILIFWTIVLGFLQTKKGQELALNHLKEYFESNTGMQLEVGTVKFSFPLNLTLSDIALSRENHLPIATLHHFEICCAYTSLLNGKVVFTKLHASDINIFHLPPSKIEPSANETLWDSPFFPFYLKFSSIDLQNIRFSSEAINSLALHQDLKPIISAISFDLQGMISNNPFRNALTAHLQIRTKSDNPQLPHLNLAVDAQNHQLSLSLHLEQMPLQIIQDHYPKDILGTLALYASAPVWDWQNFVQKRNDRTSVIEGHFKLSLNSHTDEPSLLAHMLEDQTTVRSHYRLESTGAWELVDFKAENPSLQIEGGAIVHLQKGILQAKVNGMLGRLERFNQLLGHKINGALSFSAQANGPTSSPHLNMVVESPYLQIDQQSLNLIQAKIDAKLDSEQVKGLWDISFLHQDLPWKFAADFDYQDPATFALSNILIEGMDATIKGHAACYFPEFIWEGRLLAESKTLQGLSHFLPSPLKGEGQLNLNFSQAFDAQQQKQQKIDAVWLGYNLQWNDWQARRLQLQLSLDSLKKEEGYLSIHSHMEGDGIIGQEYAVAQCAFHGDHHFDPQSLTINQIRGDWDAKAIRSKEAVIGQAVGHISLQNPMEAVEGSIEFALREVKTSRMNFSELSGATAFQTAGLSWPFRLQGKGDLNHDLTFNAEGEWGYMNEIISIQANRLTGRFGPYPLTLMQPVHFLMQPNDIQLSKLHLQLGEGELEADFSQKDQQITAQFKTNAVPSELFYFVAPNLPLAGRVSFEGALTGNQDQPKGHFQADLHDVQIIEEIFAQKPFISGKIHMDLDEEGIRLQSELMGIGRTPLIISGAVPMHFSLNPFQIDIRQSLPFNLLINAEGELDPYLHLFFHDSTNLSGHAKIALSLSGQLQSPEIRGNIDLTGGSYESLNTGALYHDIQAHLEGDGSKILLTQFSAQDNKSGSLTATGAVTIDPSLNYPFEFQINPTRVYILDSDYAAISASGPLTLIGDTKKSKLMGELAVEQATIRLEEALPKQIKSVDVQYINLGENDHLPFDEQNGNSNSTVELDIRLQSAENILIKGNHLTSEWKGSINVNGSPDNLQLHGELRVSKGEYDFNGKIFNLTQGTIHFAGDPEKKTTLYVVASKDIDRIRADIIVKGPAQKPEISFRSNPPLSQREVLSYILFNRGISDITSDQGDQLSQSFISLNSSEQTSASTDFLSRLRNNMGIDRLDFTTNDKENNNFGLQVGKHITDNIIVSVNQSMTSLSPVIAVEAKLKKNFKLQAEAGVVEDAPVRMSIKWKKDY